MKARSKRRYVKNRMPLLTVSASCMLWRCELQVQERRRSKAAVFFFESSLAPDSASPYVGDIYTSELVRNLGCLLLDAPAEYRIHGYTQVYAAPADTCESAYLGLCWGSGDPIRQAVATFLTCLPRDAFLRCWELFPGFEGDPLARAAEAVFQRYVGFCDPCIYKELAEEFGALDSVACFERVADTLSERNARQREEREREELESRRLRYGSQEDVQDAAALIERFGDAIPPGYLVHAALFGSPPVGPVTDLLLFAWGRIESPLPPGTMWKVVSLASGDLPFLQWLLSGQKEAVLSRLSSSTDPRSEAARRKLVRLATEGREKLARGQSGGGHAASIGRALATFQAGLAPDPADECPVVRDNDTARHVENSGDRPAPLHRPSPGSAGTS